MNNVKKIFSMKIVFFLLILCICISEFLLIEAVEVLTPKSELPGSCSTTPGAIEPPEIVKKYVVTNYFDLFKEYEVLVGTSIDEICLPQYSEAVLRQETSDSNDLIIELEYVGIEWDISEYNMSEAGTYIIRGKWVSEKFNIDNEASLLPNTAIKVYSKPIPVRLPDFIKLERGYLRYDLEVAIENCQKIVLWSSVDNGEWKSREMNYIPDYLFYTEDIVIDIDKTPSDPYASILFKNMKAGHIYKYKFELFGGAHSGMTNVITIAENYWENDHREDIIIGEDTEDSGGKRTGGGQYNLEDSNSKIKISKKQLNNYMLYNPNRTLFQAGKVKIAMSYEAVKKLFDITSEYVEIEVINADSNKYEIKLSVDGKLYQDFNDKVEIYFPCKNAGEKKANSGGFVNVIKDEKYLIPGSIDDKSDCIVIFSSLEGVFEISSDYECKSKNIEYSGLLAWIRFLLWMMINTR